MAGPWEAFAEQPASKPWEAFAEQKPERGFLDLALGLTGERVKTWPERAVREVLTLPKRAIDAAYSAPPGSREATEAMIPVAAETAMTLSPVRPGIAAATASRAAVPTQKELLEAGGSGYK